MSLTRNLAVFAALVAATPAYAQVVEGLRVFPQGIGSVIVEPGTCTVQGTNVVVSTTTSLEIEPTAGLPVEGERYTLTTDLPHSWMPGNHLKGCVTANALPGCLETSSVQVRLGDGTVLTEGADYRLDTEWAGLARTASGRISTGTEVLVHYRVGQRRIDTIVVSKDGSISLISGTPDNATPLPPEVPSSSQAIANVYMPYHTASVEEWQIFPLHGDMTRAPTSPTTASVARTLARLESGKPVTIVTWGDSVTVGGDSSTPEKAYANLFIQRLREQYPGSQITHINSSIGGTTTNDRLPAIQKEVLAHRPHLVTIEYVNDVTFSEENLRRNYDSAISQMRGIGAEVILMTPHFTIPSMMRKVYPRGAETRPQVLMLHSIAAEHGIALADAAGRWADLDSEGIPYITLLKNGINHPDDRGHQIFVDELLRFFPARGREISRP